MLDLKLPELEGSPRQVAWAEKLRDETMSDLKRSLELDKDVSYVYGVSNVNENIKEYRDAYKKGEKAMAAVLKDGEKGCVKKEHLKNIVKNG